MATDGTSIFWANDFVDKCDIKEIQGVLVHELMHCILMHPLRRKSRDPQRWNYACDYAVNPLVLDDGFILPEPYLYEAKYRSMSVDHIYDLLPKDPEQLAQAVGLPQAGDGNSDGDGSGDGQPAGEVLDAPIIKPGVSNSDIEQAESQWELAVEVAAAAAKTKGNLPAHIKKLIDAIAKPKVSWKAILRNFMTSTAKNDYTWSRPNRRYIAEDIYLPANFSESLGDVVIVVDTSGSITDKELSQFGSEINCILEDTNPELIHLLYCDTRIAGTEEFTSYDLPIKLEMKGGGGTDFTAPFEWVTEHGVEPACFIYLTDLYGSCSAPQPDYPVLWVCTTDMTDVPFGQVVPMN